MSIMMKQMPDRVFDVGIAEGHAVTFSAGMAKDGLMPFCNIYSSFAQRAYDNIIHDMALLNLPVVLCLDRAGLVGEDGPTHHGAFDLAALRPVPHLTIASPMDEHELRNLMFSAQLPQQGCYVIRYPRGNGVLTDWRNPMQEIKTGTGRKLKEGSDVAVLTLGPIGNDAAEAIAEVEKEEEGRMSVAHYDMRFCKPLDEELLQNIAAKFKRIITIEDSAELRFLEHPHVVRLEARPRNAEGTGEVTIRDLVINALRMRPDRIVVGECRGAEALDMLQAMNTGHDGSLTTLHANSPADVVSRLATMVRYAVDLPVDVIESNVASAFEVVVQTARALDGSRFVSDVAELVYDGGKRCCRVRPLFMRGLAERVGRWVALPAWIDEVADIGVAEREEVERWKRTSCLAA